MTVAHNWQKGDTDLLQSRRISDPMADRPEPNSDAGAPPWRILVQLGGENHTSIGVQVRPVLTIGRADADGDYLPDLDFAPHGGSRNGVSRYHAEIRYEDGQLYLTDLESTNGTRINGFALVAGHAYRLRDGDEVEFGRQRAVLRFVRASR